MAWPIKHKNCSNGMTSDELNDWLKGKFWISLDNVFHTQQAKRPLECDRIRNRCLGVISIQISQRRKSSLFNSYITLLRAAAKVQLSSTQILLEHTALPWAASLHLSALYNADPDMRDFLDQLTFICACANGQAESVSPSNPKKPMAIRHRRSQSNFGQQAMDSKWRLW